MNRKSPKAKPELATTEAKKILPRSRSNLEIDFI